MQPLPNRASTGYCLANPTGDHAEFLVYLPSGGNVTVDLSGGTGISEGRVAEPEYR